MPMKNDESAVIFSSYFWGATLYTTQVPARSPIPWADQKPEARANWIVLQKRRRLTLLEAFRQLWKITMFKG